MINRCDLELRKVECFHLRMGQISDRLSAPRTASVSLRSNGCNGCLSIDASCILCDMIFRTSWFARCQLVHCRGAVGCPHRSRKTVISMLWNVSLGWLCCCWWHFPTCGVSPQIMTLSKIYHSICIYYILYVWSIFAYGSQQRGSLDSILLQKMHPMSFPKCGPNQPLYGAPPGSLFQEGDAIFSARLWTAVEWWIQLFHGNWNKKGRGIFDDLCILSITYDMTRTIWDLNNLGPGFLNMLELSQPTGITLTKRWTSCACKPRSWRNWLGVGNPQW